MRYKYLIFLSMLYVLLDGLPSIFPYKPALVPIEYIANAGLLNAATVIGISWVCLCDIIAEVYGMQVSIKLYWTSTACRLILDIICYFLIIAPFSAFWYEQNSYATMFDTILYRGILGDVCFVVGWYVNIYFLTKWKALTKGKYFWLRSVASNLIGQIIFTLLLGIALVLVGKFHFYGFEDFFARFISSLITKMSLIALLSFPASLIVALLKIIENSENTKNKYKNVNPFQCPS